MKGVGGIIGITEDPSSLAQWILIGPTLVRLVDDFQENYHDTDEHCPHHEEGKSSQMRFLRHVQNMSDSILQVGNPFQEEKKLVSLHGRVFMSVSPSEAVHQIDTLGRSQYEDYKEAVLENRTRNLQTSIKKNKLIYFKQVKQRKTATQKKLSHFKDHTSLYGQLFVSLHTHLGNLSLFFEHEFVIPPPAMKTTNDKAALNHCIIEADCAEGHRANGRAPFNRLQFNNYRWWSPHSHDATKTSMLNI